MSKTVSLGIHLRHVHMVGFCPYHDTATTKSVDLLHAVYNKTSPSPSIDMCKHVHQHVTAENETEPRTKQSSTWHVYVSPSAGTTADTPHWPSRGDFCLPQPITNYLIRNSLVQHLCRCGCCCRGSISKMTYPDVSIVSGSAYPVSI